MNSKVLMIVQSYYPTDPRIRREAEALVQAGYGVDVISLRSETEPSQQIVHGVRMFGIPLDRKFGTRSRYIYEYGVFLVCAAVLALRLHLQHRYKLIQIANLPDTLVLAALLPKLLGARVVFDAHESLPESFRVKFGWREGSGKDRFLIFLQRFCMNLADSVITIHEPFRQLFITRGISAQKISVVMNWPDERLFKSETVKERTPHEGFRMIYAGTVAERYGLQTAIRALPLLRDKIPNLQLRIVGKGDHIDKLRSLVADLGLGEIVSFEDPVPLAQVADLYRSCDVGISPQEHTVFGNIYFSTKVAEYLAVGLPAVVACTPVMARYFNSSQVAFFEPGDPLDFTERVLEIYQSDEYREHLIANGLQLSRQYNWTQERAKYVSLITNLADGNTSRQVEGSLDSQVSKIANKI